MSLEDNKKLVRAFLEASTVGDAASMGNMMADDASWWIMPSPLAAAPMSKADFIAFFPEFYKNFAGPFTMEFGEMTAEDDRVSLISKGNVLLKNGKTYASDYHWLFTIRDGKIAYVKEFGNTFHAVEVFSG